MDDRIIRIHISDKPRDLIHLFECINRDILHVQEMHPGASLLRIHFIDAQWARDKTGEPWNDGIALDFEVKRVSNG